MLSYNDIISYKFEKAGFGGGYRPEDVDKFTMRVATDFQKLEAEKAEVEQKLVTLAGKVEEYREDEESLRAALLGAQKLGDSIIRESKQKGEMIIAAAKGEAQRVSDDIRRQIEREQGTLAKVQQEASNFKNRLLLLYKQHLELISSIPGQDVPVDAQEIINSSQNPQRQSEEQAAEQTASGDTKPSGEAEAQGAPVTEELPRRESQPEENFRPQEATFGGDEEQKAGAMREAQRNFADELFAADNLDDDFSSIVEGLGQTGRNVPPIESPQAAPSKQENKQEQRESRFGELRFGDGYDLRRG